MVKFIMELVCNCSFILATGTLRRLRNGVTQRSVLAPFLFNAYMYDLPTITSKKFACADDLAIMHCAKDWKVLKKVLSQDMATMSMYLRKWKVKLSTTKTVSAAFHLNNREASRELNVTVESQNILSCAEPTYLGVKMDRILTF